MAHQTDFDMLQLHLAHGYLLAGFISPLTNTRQDNYGGPLENRLRFPIEIFKAVRLVWPESKPISVALSASDWAKGGLKIEDVLLIVKQLKSNGCDIIEVLAGQTTANTKPIYGPYFLAPYSDRLRNEGNIPTITSGGITTNDHVNSLLAAGRADLCVMHPTHLGN